MKRWFLDNIRQRNRGQSKACHSRYGRRLSIERYEDRLLLSGSSLTSDPADAATVPEGGFLQVDSGGFLVSGASDFVSDTNDVRTSVFSNGMLLTTQWKLLNEDVQFSIPTSLNLNRSDSEKIQSSLAFDRSISFSHPEIANSFTSTYNANSQQWTAVAGLVGRADTIGDTFGIAFQNDYLSSRYTAGVVEIGYDGSINLASDIVASFEESDFSVLVAAPTVSHFAEIGSGIVTTNAPTDFLGFNVAPPNTSSLESASSIASPIAARDRYELDLYGPLFHALDVLSTDDPDAQVRTPVTIVKASSDATLDEQQGSPALDYKTAELLVINEPIPITSEQISSSESISHEGGTLEVSTALASTQHAYETQLAALVVFNLDRDEILPARAPQRTQPVVAELARLVTFELAGQHELTNTDGTDQPAGRNREDTSAATSKPESTSAHIPAKSVSMNLTHSREHAMPAEFAESSAREADDDALQTFQSSARFDDKHQSVSATAFAQWPAFAAAVASYILIERRGQSAVQAVQTPPRRKG